MNRKRAVCIPCQRMCVFPCAYPSAFLLTTAKPLHTEPEAKPVSSLRTSFLPSILDNKENKELTTALRRRRARFARHAQQQEMLNSNGLYNGILNSDYSNGNYCSGKNYNAINGHHGEEDRPIINNLSETLKNGLFIC